MRCKGDVFPGELQPWSSFIFALTFLRRGCCDVCRLPGPPWVTPPTSQHGGHRGRLLPLLSPSNLSGYWCKWEKPCLVLLMHQLHETSCIFSEPTRVSPRRKSTFAFTHRQKTNPRKQNKPQKRCSRLHTMCEPNSVRAEPVAGGL